MTFRGKIKNEADGGSWLEEFEMKVASGESNVLWLIIGIGVLLMKSEEDSTLGKIKCATYFSR